MDQLFSHQQKGFTLIELVIVLAVLSVLIVTTTMKWPERSMYLNAQIRQLTNDIQYTQILAMSRNERYCIQFSDRSYALTRPNEVEEIPIDFPAAMNEPRNTISLTSGITLSFPLNLLPNGKLIFDGQGIPYNNIAVLVDPIDITLTLQETGQSKTITILPETGKVQL